MKTTLIVPILATALSAVAEPLRPPAVPLVTFDPYFSLWSAGNTLTSCDTTFWTGTRQPFTLTLTADGRTYRLCGRKHGSVGDLPVLDQVACEVGATVTRYAFEGRAGLRAEVLFVSPRLTDDLDVFARPVTYVTVRVAGAKSWSVKAAIDDAFATHEGGKPMERAQFKVDGVACEKVGRAEQEPFSQRGDQKRPNWGWVCLAGPVAEADAAHFLLAYDDVKSVRFFGEELPAWWRRDGKGFETMLSEALRDRAALTAKCLAFDREFAHDMEDVAGSDYADVARLAWRQSFGACRIVRGPGGEPFFFSNENGSGGMIGTTDVFYPQIPHLLMTSLPLVKATLAPTCIYAASTNWPYGYAPHDLGLFPLAEGQFYGMRRGQSVGGGSDDTSRMPVEECGNMLLCLGALAKAEGNADFAGRWWPTITSWAQYLEKFGFDPGNQLCTDDFAGHLAHNANLSVKSIEALAAYGLMAGMRGDRAAEKRYAELARKLAAQWCEAAKGGAHGGYRLAFDRPGTWSLKYNMVWDRLLGFNLFPPEVAEAEMRAYRAEACRYGVPLDSRKTYTKADWEIWAGQLTGRKEDVAFMASGLRRFLQETPDRVPFTDWYYADSGLFRGFIARSVVGGVFMPVLFRPDLVRKYRHPAPPRRTVDVRTVDEQQRQAADEGPHARHGLS